MGFAPDKSPLSAACSRHTLPQYPTCRTPRTPIPYLNTPRAVPPYPTSVPHVQYPHTLAQDAYITRYLVRPYPSLVPCILYQLRNPHTLAQYPSSVLHIP
eukprot:154137-Rhodomonas_salina.1